MCGEFQEEGQNILPGENFTNNFCFGLIDKKQKKTRVISENDMADAYATAINGQGL